MAWSGAASHLRATRTLSSPVLHRAPGDEKAVFHARFVGGQVQRVNIASSSFKRQGQRRRDCCNACLPHHCAPSARGASSRIEVALGRARQRRRPAWPGSRRTWPASFGLGHEADIPTCLPTYPLSESCGSSRDARLGSWTRSRTVTGLLSPAASVSLLKFSPAAVQVQQHQKPDRNKTV